MIVRWIHIIFSFLLCCSLMAQETPAELLPPPPMVSISSYGLNNGLVENCLSGAVLDKKGRLWLNPCEYAASERGRNFFQFDGTKSHFFSIREELQNATKKRVPLFVAGETKQGFLFGSDRLRSSAFMWHPDTKEQYFFDFEEDERLIGITEANELGLFSLVKQENTLRIYHLHPKEKKLIGKIQVPNISELVNMGTTELFPFVLSKQKLWTLTMAPSLISFDLKKQEFEVKPLESFFGVKPIKRFWPSNDVFLRKLRILSITEDELFLFLGPYGWYSYKISEQKIDPITWLNEIFVQKGTENLFINMSIDLKGNILFQFGDYSYGRLPEADNVSFLPTILMDQNRKLYDYSVLTERIKSSSQYDNVLSWAGEYYSNDFKQEMVWATFAGLYTVDLQPQAGIRTYPMSLGSRAIAEIDSQNIIFSSDIKLHAINLNQEKEVKNLNLISKPNVHTSIIPFKGRQVWLTSGNQLLKYDYESGKVDTIDLGLMIEKFGFVAEDQMIFFPYKANAFLYNINTRQKKDVLIKGLPFKLDIHINDIYISSESSIWLATKDGLWHIDRAKEEVKLYDTDDGLPENHIMCIELGENGKLWLGTLNSGVVIFDPANNSSKVISEVNGLSKNIVTAILTDEEQNRWVATFDGITVISPQGKVLFELSEENGLTHNEFNKSSYLKLSDGRMIFGGVEGLNLIDPIEVKKLFEEDRTLNIYLNSLTYYDNEKEKESIYTGDVSFNKPILIPSANRYLKLDFALSEYGNTMNHTYAYRVIPAKKKVEANNTMEWINLGPVSDLTLNTLMAGDYVVQIRGFDQKGKEAMAFLEVPIKVEQFFYKTWWFYVLCSIPFLLGAFIWIRRNFSERKQLQVEVERRTRQILEDKETIESQAEELRNLDRAKNRFFTNISHEFRTPLTLILGMADQIEQEFKKSKEKTSLIKKNGANLLELINQMLELQKLDADKLTLNMQLGDIIPLLQSIFDQFQAFAGSKKQKLEMILAEEELEMDHDPEKILRIVSNLLSNAIKYTSEEGKVTFEVTSSRAAQDNTKQALILKVKDTGMGIAQEELPYLFDRFYQAGYVQQTGGGTGIGLSLTHELVQLMEGKIEVTSDLGQGSVFTVHLPITRNAEPGHLDVPFQVQGAIFGEVQSPVSEVIEGTDLPVALVVEDNQDIRKYLQFCLKGHYQVELAVNGQEGIEKALESIPEIIISDVMMPERDGFELSEVLKEDIRTSHIPIILLTAKSDVASRIYGLKHGADDYLAKPFNEEELIVRMQNLLQLRQKLQDRYKDLYGQPIENIAEKDVSKEDELMLNLKAILDENLSDPKFDIEELCKQLHISRSTLGRKIKALTGRSLNVYIRSLRLQKAKQLLLTTDLTVKEVGYEVGFFTSTYFSRTYLEEFGETPGKTRENQSI